VHPCTYARERRESKNSSCWVLKYVGEEEVNSGLVVVENGVSFAK
jgi:hypothetical protein